MAEFRQGVITSKGAALLAKAQAGTVKITFTKFQIGNGVWSDDTSVETLMAQVALKSFKAEFAIASAKYVNDATSLLTMVASNVNNTSGYYIREVGVYATDGTTEVLYAIYLAYADTADWFPAYNSITPSSVTYSCYISVGNASTVTVNNASASLVTKETLDALEDEMRTNEEASYMLLLNEVRQNKWELEADEGNISGLMLMEKGTVTLTNTSDYPFNNSQKSVALTTERASTDYIVTAKVTSAVGNPGEIVVSDQLVNGFKLAYTGSATSVTVEYMVTGGLWK